MSAPQTTSQWELNDSHPEERSDLIKIRRSNGRYEWVTSRELELLNSKKDREQRIRRLHRQRNAALALAAAAFVLAAALLVHRLLRPAIRPLDDESADSRLASGPSEERTADARARDDAVATAQERSSIGEEANGDAAATDLDGEIAHRVAAWAEAWSRQDPEVYLSYYSAGFQPPDGISRTRWERLRRQRIVEPAFIDVEVGDLQVTRFDDGQALARFVQVYRAPGYQDRVAKALEMAREDGGWRIVAEHASPLPAEP